MKKLICPVCNSHLIYHRKDDGELIIEIEEDDYIEKENYSDGYTDVYCAKDKSHCIPNQLQQKVIDYVEVNI